MAYKQEQGTFEKNSKFQKKIKIFKKFKFSKKCHSHPFSQLLVEVTCSDNKVPVTLKLSCLRGWQVVKPGFTCYFQFNLVFQAHQILLVNVITREQYRLSVVRALLMLKAQVRSAQPLTCMRTKILTEQQKQVSGNDIYRALQAKRNGRS